MPLAAPTLSRTPRVSASFSSEELLLSRQLAEAMRRSERQLQRFKSRDSPRNSLSACATVYNIYNRSGFLRERIYRLAAFALRLFVGRDRGFWLILIRFRLFGLFVPLHLPFRHCFLPSFGGPAWPVDCTVAVRYANSPVELRAPGGDVQAVEGPTMVHVPSPRIRVLTFFWPRLHLRAINYSAPP
jgi:hypothetical protein